MVASGRYSVHRRYCNQVSIPFIAGQWSLQGPLAHDLLWTIWFQSPSLRGSGRFILIGALLVGALWCFNPLHCGAVVASWRVSHQLALVGSFNPLHCGAVVASAHGSYICENNQPSFNPLHCGAVVASVRRVRRVAGFNPLHCGAVVASLLSGGTRFAR